MDLFYSNSKKEALKKLEMAQNAYEMTGERASSSVLSLYDKRKEAVISIEKAEQILKKQPDFGIDNIKKIAEARASIRLFTEAMHNEENWKAMVNGSTGKYAGAAMAGTAAGAAIAAFGPAAAMALATTFGTAATGTAISTLSGIAATNAALAWLGGGAIAVGGGGMAAGSAILTMLGPVGLAIGTATAGLAGFKAAKKNKEIAEKADEMTRVINSKKDKLEKSISEINQLREQISSDISALNALMKGTSADNGVNYNYSEIIIIIVSLCIKTNQKFTL